MEIDLTELLRGQHNHSCSKSPLVIWCPAGGERERSLSLGCM